jgi:uncharacterized protein Smg (DUF494 family)
VGDRVLEIVVFLMAQIRDDKGRIDDLEEISSYLKSQGFTDKEISSAYSYILNKMQGDAEFCYETGQESKGTRIFTESERQHFLPEAAGYIMQLKHLGLLNDEQIEQILERGAYLWPSPINLEQIKLLVDSVMFADVGSGESNREYHYYISDDLNLLN